MSRDKDRIYDQAIAAAVAADWLRRDANGDRFAVDEAEWLVYAREGLISLHQYISNHGEDQDVKHLADSLLGQIRKYLDHRMQSKGLVKRFEGLRRRFEVDGLRHSFVREIQGRGFSQTKACEIAVDCLSNADHPLVMNEGVAIDQRAMEKSVQRWEQSGLPDELWRLPGQSIQDPFPDIDDHLKRFRY